MKYHKATIKRVYDDDMDAAVYEVYDLHNNLKGILPYLNDAKEFVDVNFDEIYLANH